MARISGPSATVSTTSCALASARSSLAVGRTTLWVRYDDYDYDYDYLQAHGLHRFYVQTALKLLADLDILEHGEMPE